MAGSNCVLRLAGGQAGQNSRKRPSFGGSPAWNWVKEFAGFPGVTGRKACGHFCANVLVDFICAFVAQEEQRVLRSSRSVQRSYLSAGTTAPDRASIRAFHLVP